MNILILSATTFEIANLIKIIDFKQISPVLYQKKIDKKNIDLLISGIGLSFTAYKLSKALLEKKYDLVINLGIAGSFNSTIKIGELTQVISEQFADLGIKDKDKFIDVFEAGLVNANEFPFVNGKLTPKILKITEAYNLKKVHAVSVNTVSGNKNEIEQLKKKYQADIESMEGAAVFYVCMEENVPVIQLRSISNYIEERDKSKWNIPLAIENLNNFCVKLFYEL